MAITESGDFYLAEFGSGKIRFINTTAGQVTTVNLGNGNYSSNGILVDTPTHLALDNNGNLYISVSGEGAAILKFDESPYN